jgi:hypothetical protein
MRFTVRPAKKSAGGCAALGQVASTIAAKAMIVS